MTTRWPHNLETFALANQDIAFTTHKGKFKERLKKQQLRTHSRHTRRS